MSLVCCLFPANCLQAFLCIIFRRSFLPSGTTVMQTNLIQCAAYGLTPAPLQPLQQNWQHS
ncbi:unnamed protein product [Staurois parvus]|uniref:Uncharacterized protein n=1 Tax=Staurois parvus TaxID=386267 RepID=A0ABN9EX40_9NEOB|nr:unnamed protein product [Staurois parvus]